MNYIIIVAILLNMVRGWWGTGHLLVARIAQFQLEKKDPETLKEALDLLSELKRTGSAWADKEDKHPFVECATFADDIKQHKAGRYQKSWHFVDQPYLDEGGELSDYPDFEVDEHNVVEVIKDLGAWFRKKDSYADSNSYQEIMDHTYQEHSERNGLSTALRFLVHYVGDVHQPLHAMSRVNHRYPKGDRGGNLFRIPDKDRSGWWNSWLTHLWDSGSKWNLHAVWDSALYEFPGYGDTPFDDDGWKSISDTAQLLMKKHSVSGSEADNLDATSWAQESFQVGKDFVYQNVKENQDLPQKYIEQGLVIAEKRIVLAGTRLANLLMSFKLGHSGESVQPKAGDTSRRVLVRIFDGFTRNAGYI